MNPEYTIPDVSAEFIMDVAKILANSATPMTVDDVRQCFEKKYSAAYVTSALTACAQLGGATQHDQSYSASERLRSDIKRASKSELYIPFQVCLKNYAPFLLYSDFISKEYSSMESAARARGILRIKTSQEIVEKSLRLWGLYSTLLEYDKKTGKFTLRIEIERLSAEYVMRLLRALEAELKAKVFLIDMLGPEVFAYLDQNQISLDDLTSALLDYEADPKGAASKATQTFELFLWKLAEQSGVEASKLGGLTGVIRLADAIRAEKKMLVNHHHLSHGIGGIRNLSHHDPDMETGKVWTVTKQGALLGALLVPATIRSLTLYFKENRQEL